MQLKSGTRLYSASDICNFLECRHLTSLDLQHLVSPMEKVVESDENRLIQQKGLEHEAAYLESLRQVHGDVVDIAEGGEKSFAEKVEQTIKAMQAGVDLIFQGALQEGNYIGHADFLRKVAVPSTLGDYSYEVIDTKLAKSPKAKFIVQMALYSRMLIPIQGIAPQHMHVVLGDSAMTEHSFRVADYADYFEQVVQRFEASVGNTAAASTYPEPCAHCGFCPWRERCKQQRIDDDHLTFVANISKTQIKKLRSVGVTTLTQLAQSGDELHVPKLSRDTLVKLRHQARLQFQGRSSEKPLYELLPATAFNRGFARVPEPVEGDLFFDMEGDPLEEGGLEYLFGLYIDEAGEQRFEAFWAHSRAEEKLAFERFIDFLMAHLQRFPGAHIYHYASYEETAIKRLMTQHGTREAQVDWLLRNGKLIDLYKVVREAIRVSEPSYSIKYIEHFYMPKRDGEVTSAGASIVFYERWKKNQDPELLEKIERYNEDDVRSTFLLRNWLLHIRPTTAGRGHIAVADTAEEPVAAGVNEIEIRLQRYHQALLGQLPEDEAQWDENARAKEMVFQLLDFHRRADKPVWWDMFQRQDMSRDELMDDIESLAGLERTNQPPVPEKRSFLYQYRFPEQETKLRAGSEGVVVETLGRINLHELDVENRLATFKATQEPASGAVFDMGPGGPIDSSVMREALFRYADSFLTGGGGFKALDDFLHRRAPSVAGVNPGDGLLAAQLPPLDAIKQTVRNLTDSTLFIQGPPGAGKTYTGSHVIVDLLRAGKRIGITSNSHHAINNLLSAIETQAEEEGLQFNGLKKCSKDAESEFDGRCIRSIENRKQFLAAWSDQVSLIAGTAWLFADETFTDELDYLFIDEAGQVSVANLIAMGMSARNIVLMGDQMQLSQPIKGAHPGRSGDSILDYLLDGAATIPADRGVFLAQSWRMHPAVCSFVSEAVYEGQLSAAAGNERQVLILDGQHPEIPDSGLMFCPVTHDGNSQRSEEEATVVRDLYQYFLGRSFQNKKGEQHVIGRDNILVVAPYNLQVQLIKRLLPEGARVGTVDKFQGQEAEIVIVSMATSNEDYLPRDIGFLYSKNRLNVAISRAKSLACIVASPALTAIRCKTPAEMALVNMLCKAVNDGATQVPETA